MRILVGKCFGLGNAVMSVPMFRAIKQYLIKLSTTYSLDVLIGTTEDDGGAWDVFDNLKQHGIIDNIYTDFVPSGFRHDIAVMSIPFDGRWQNNLHFVASKVIDGRTRPDPTTTGLVSWERHEVQYQMENAYEIGYRGITPPMCFYKQDLTASFQNSIYLGIGYKKDTNNLWSVKHWGTENYIKLIKILQNAKNPPTIKSTGDLKDWNFVLKQVVASTEGTDITRGPSKLEHAFRELSRCSLYVGNDTGMMHVAASMGIPCIGLFFMKNSIIKNKPWGDDHTCLSGLNKKITPKNVMKSIKRFIDVD